MKKNRIISITLITVICISFVLILPVLSISIGLSNYGIIEKRIEYQYNPSNPSAIEKLCINSEIGDIEIKYISPPVDYLVKIELNLEMAGLDVAGKDYSDYFTIEGLNDLSPANFMLKFRSDIDQHEVISLIKSISIVVYLRMDILFDLIIIAEDSDVDLLVPFGVSISNIMVNVTRGDIDYEFNQCTICGNITGLTDFGNIVFKTNDVRYTQTSRWNFSNNQGEIHFNITQNREIGANVTCTGETNTGSIIIFYKDYNSKVGALFTFHNTGSSDGEWRGFEETGEINEDKWWLSRLFYYSNDFPGVNHYNISLYGYERSNRLYSYNLLNTI